MKVKELIKILKEFPNNADVKIDLILKTSEFESGELFDEENGDILRKLSLPLEDVETDEQGNVSLQF